MKATLDAPLSYNHFLMRQPAKKLYNPAQIWYLLIVLYL